MKTMRTILLFIFCAIAQNSLQAQVVAYANPSKDSNQDKHCFQYLVGSEKSGYQLKVCSYTCENSVPVKTFSNGRSAPILQVYVMNKNQYIGGTMTDSKNNKTTIKDITLVEKDSTLLFTVVGEKFSMSFTLSTGIILKEEEKSSTFYSDNQGAWVITKK
jgi:hypothetical protein